MAITITEDEGADMVRLAQRGDQDGLTSIVDQIAAREHITKGEVLVRARDEYGRTALHGAAMLGNTNIIHMCANHPTFREQPGLRLSMLNARDKDKETPLITAVKANEVAAVLALIQHGAEVDIEVRFGWYAAHHAAALGFDNVLRELVKNHGAVPDAMSKAGDTPAHLAARHNHAGCFRILYEVGADLQTYNATRETPACVAIKMQHTEVLEVMKEIGLI